MKINSLIVTNTCRPHKNGGLHHNQIDYIFTQKIFATSVNINKTRSFPGADIGSDHALVMMTLNLRLRSQNKNKFVLY